jgi:uncharacterized protein with HEPN domain
VPCLSQFRFSQTPTAKLTIPTARPDRELLEDILVEIHSAFVAREYLNTCLATDEAQRALHSTAYRATLYSLITIGEAVKKLSIAFRDGNPQIPWADIAGMRDILVHDYFDVDEAIVLETVSQSLQPLHEFCQQILLRS